MRAWESTARQDQGEGLIRVEIMDIEKLISAVIVGAMALTCAYGTYIAWFKPDDLVARYRKQELEKRPLVPISETQFMTLVQVTYPIGFVICVIFTMVIISQLLNP
jgi:hypothetical protein